MTSHAALVAPADGQGLRRPAATALEIDYARAGTFTVGGPSTVREGGLRLDRRHDGEVFAGDDPDARRPRSSQVLIHGTLDAAGCADLSSTTHSS